MTLQTKWSSTAGTVTLPNPDANGITINDGFVGAARRTLGGAFRADQIAQKAQINIRWSGIGSSEKATLWGAFGSFGTVSSSVLTLPNGDYYTVLAAPGGWQEALYYLENGTLETHDVSLTFFEV